MDMECELAENAHYEKLDAGKPTCHKCGCTERVATLVWCGATHCNNSICQECASQVEFELEACGEEHAADIARQMMNREMSLRHELYRQRAVLRRLGQRERMAA